MTAWQPVLRKIDMETMMQFSLRDLQAHTGSEVEGVDLRRPIAEEGRAKLRRALADRGVLVFNNQDLDPQSFAQAMQNFGELMPQQAKQFCLPDYPIVGYISNRDFDKPTGKLLVRGEQYHTDHSNYEAPPIATALYGVEIPSKGGDTQFVNVQAAYDELSAEMKARIDSLRCRHVGESSRSPRKLASPEPGQKKPETSQPLVTVHPENGRKGLYLNTARIEYVEGLDYEEGHALVAELMAFATAPKYEYRHRWQKGDVVIWDNRTVMHQANGDVPKEEYRHLYRLMIVGAPLLAA